MIDFQFQNYLEFISFDFVFKATAEANNLSAVAEAKDLYMQSMENVCGGTKPFLASAHLESEHHRCLDKALHQFQNKRKMGGEEFSQLYMEKLQKVRFINYLIKTFKNISIFNCPLIDCFSSCRT